MSTERSYRLFVPSRFLGVKFTVLIRAKAASVIFNVIHVIRQTYQFKSLILLHSASQPF